MVSELKYGTHQPVIYLLLSLAVPEDDRLRRGGRCSPLALRRGIDGGVVDLMTCTNLPSMGSGNSIFLSIRRRVLDFLLCFDGMLLSSGVDDGVSEDEAAVVASCLAANIEAAEDDEALYF